MNDLFAPAFRKVNGGCYRKGHIPLNKGHKGVSTRSNGVDISVKGKHGFQPHPVVCVNPDGTIHARFESIKAAVEATGVHDRHSIIKACQGKFRCRGYMWYYEEDFVRWADYHYNFSIGRDIYGRLLPGNKLKIGQTLSPEGKARRIASARATAARMLADPNCRFGKGNGTKRVYCKETDKEYASIKACAADLGLNPAWISAAISRHGSVHGYHFHKLKNKE